MPTPTSFSHRASCFVALIALAVSPMVSRLLAQTASPSIEGGWTLNKDLSDAVPDRPDGTDRGGRGERGGPGGGPGGGGFGPGRGGFGRGGGMGQGGGGDAPRGNDDDRRRLMDAMRDIFESPDHLIVTQSATTVILTSADGRVTRLATDGSKVKDDSTGIERKTRWEGGKLVSDISGPLGKITQTWAVDPEHHQLQVTVRSEGQRGQPRVVHRVYDADPK